MMNHQTAHNSFIDHMPEISICAVIIWAVTTMVLYMVAQRKLQSGLFYLLTEIVFSFAAFSIHVGLIYTSIQPDDFEILTGLLVPLFIILIPPCLLVWEIANESLLGRTHHPGHKEERIRYLGGNILWDFQLEEDEE